MCVCVYVFSEDEHKLIQQYCHNLNGHKSDTVSFHSDIHLLLIVFLCRRLFDRVDLVKTISNVRSSVCAYIRT